MQLPIVGLYIDCLRRVRARTWSLCISTRRGYRPSNCSKVHEAPLGSQTTILWVSVFGKKSQIPPRADAVRLYKINDHET